MKLLHLFLGSMCVLTAACSVEKDEPAEEVKPPIEKPVIVQGPKMEGEWFSTCFSKTEKAEEGREQLVNQRLVLKFDGINLDYSKYTYADDMCLESIDSQKMDGIYKYTKNLGDGVFAVDFKLPTADKLAAHREFNLSFIEDTLKVSALYSLYDKQEAYDPDLVLSKTYNGPNPEFVPRLKPGVYEYKKNDFYQCDQALSTEKKNGVVSRIYIDYLGRCSGQLELNCEKRFCKTDGFRMIIRSEYSYEFIENETGHRSIFQKR